MVSDVLPSQYAPAEVEARRYEHWEKAAAPTPEAQENPDAPSYTIVLPPPNVTGILHIGHALNHTLSDILIRRRRMQGYRTLWLPGMDRMRHRHPERRSSASWPRRGLSRARPGREAFVERVWQWKGEYGGRILSQMRRLGDSVDGPWRFTMDEGCPGPSRRSSRGCTTTADLPRRADHQPGARAASPRCLDIEASTTRGRRRGARLHPLRQRGRQHRRGDHARGDDARRHQRWPSTPTTSGTSTCSAPTVERRSPGG